MSEVCFKVDQAALNCVTQVLTVWAAGEQDLPQGGALYLVGSALTCNTPRDLDVRLILPDAVFEKRYGCTVSQWEEEGQTGQWTKARMAWSDECVTLTHRACRSTERLVDFQVYPETHQERRYEGLPRRLLTGRAPCLAPPFPYNARDGA